MADPANVHATLKKDVSAVEDADVKELAAKLESTVARHLAKVRELAAAVK